MRARLSLQRLFWSLCSLQRLFWSLRSLQCWFIEQGRTLYVAFSSSYGGRTNKGSLCVRWSQFCKTIKVKSEHGSCTVTILIFPRSPRRHLVISTKFLDLDTWTTRARLPLIWPVSKYVTWSKTTLLTVMACDEADILFCSVFGRLNCKS